MPGRSAPSTQSMDNKQQRKAMLRRKIGPVRQADWLTKHRHAGSNSGLRRRAEWAAGSFQQEGDDCRVQRVQQSNQVKMAVK